MRDKTYFISDLHLGARYISDEREHERRVCSFLESVGHDAARLYLLGDVLDYWFEYRDVVPRGFVRFFGALARLADMGVEIVWITGNHDIWLFDYLRDEIGLSVVDAPYVVSDIDGHRFVLAHGDRVGDRKPVFRFLCALFRNKVCQRLYASIHPRWTVRFARSWSRHSRETSKGVDRDVHVRHITEAADMLRVVCPGAEYIVLGHHHLMLDGTTSDGLVRLVVLGDWITGCSYGVFDGHTFELRVYDGK